MTITEINKAILRMLLADCETQNHIEYLAEKIVEGVGNTIIHQETK